MRTLLFFFGLLILVSCTKSTTTGQSLQELVKDSPAIEGKRSYLNSPYVTAGNRLYMVGHQDGSFPEIGWHIKGEMGGVWNHPIKLMDGFDVELLINDQLVALDSANSFTNYPYANKHTYELSDHQLTVERYQLVPDATEGILIQYHINNTAKAAATVALKFNGNIDLRPTWLGKETGMLDAQDTAVYDQAKDLYLAKDKNNPWYVVFGANQKSVRHSTSQSFYDGKGTTAALVYKLEIPPNTSKELTFVIAGSYLSKTAALDNYSLLTSDYYRLAEAKKQRYKSLEEQTKLTVPDKDIQQAFEWLKYNSDWLVRTVPEIGTGITAGIPDYPWWFGVDSEYALRGYMMIGQTEAVYSTIRLLDSVSNKINGNGRIIHEMSTNGKVFNKGNINETPQFASLIWNIYCWNGDRTFLQTYFPTIERGLEWLMTERDANKNGFPDGFGMMEIHGLDSEMIDVAVYTQQAFADASKMAEILNKPTLSETYAQTAETLKTKINTEFWSEDFGSYADFIGTDQQALQLIEDAIVRADTLNKPWAVAELKATKQQLLSNPSTIARPFVLHHNWVVNTPMETGIADSSKARIALKTAEQFTSPFGVFVTGIDRDASAGSDEGSFKGSKQFSYTGAVMTLPTGVQIIGENRYGNPDQALHYLKRLNRSFSYALPGSMYEVSPDYGMITQAWNIYSYAVPIVEQFFGIQPDAFNKTITIKPQMPSTWNEASLENLSVGDIKLSVFFSRDGNGQEQLRVVKSAEDWTINIELPHQTINH